jgi:hypothetical protein
MIQNETTMKEEDSVSRDERRTVELCGEEHAGHRCIRARGHQGQHESHTPTTVHSWT